MCFPLGSTQYPGTQQYQYTADLLALDRTATKLLAGPGDPRLTAITTPLKWNEWAKMLAHHPDRPFANYILSGISEGFRVGFNFRVKLKAANKNMRSALQHPEVVQRHLETETKAGRVLGPFPPGDIKVHTSTFGVIPKKYKPGKWRLILDLSHPENSSVNDGISCDLCSLSYLKLDEVADAILQFGRGALLAKLDLANAYRIVPVSPADRHLLGMLWKGQIYIDAVLSFGLRSAPKIFTALADAITWGLRAQGVRYVDHYLDDWITIGSPSSAECPKNCEVITTSFAKLGCPIAPEKTEGPATRLEYLGIEIDTVSLIMRLPRSKLERLRQELEQWQSRKVCKKRELQSIIGLLQHAATVVRPGRSFVRRMIDLLKTAKKPEHHIRLNAAFRSDLKWWQVFCASWNGVSMLTATHTTQPDTVITTDASGGWGCGGYWDEHWFQLQWNDHWLETAIAPKELLPILIACAIWGHRWGRKVVLARSDNQATVSVINSRSCREPEMMHLLRCLFFLEAKYQFKLISAHIPGIHNTLADDLSRNQAFSFLLKAPQFHRLPDPISAELLDILVVRRLDWTCTDWIKLFSATSNKA